MDNNKFPEGFMWCVATAAHQIEGASRTDGKGDSIWNTFEKIQGNIADDSSADVACDSYHRYHDDIKMLKELGLSYYRFSISWPRILPNGDLSVINQLGIQYYNDLINALLKENISPVVTLYHWDLPEALQTKGGWKNEEIVENFDSYARLCFKHFGDRVKYWLTFNEPICTTWLGHGIGIHAPGVKEPLTSVFPVAHHIILSHARVWRTYNEEFRQLQNGKLGITLNSEWGEPLNRNDPEDVEASERFMQFKLGWFANPIFGTGDYPDLLKAQIHQLSVMAGCAPLPVFTPQQIRENRGSSDFFGLNHYTTRLVTKVTDLENSPSSEEALTNVKESVDPSWRLAGSPWLYEVPFGFRRLLNWVKHRYQNPPIFILENGTSDNKGEIEDDFRVEYYRRYLKQVLKAIHEDDCKVIGYAAWTLMDNFEWDQGYIERFGLYHVDFASPEKTRTPKKSARFFAQLVRDNGFAREQDTPLARSKPADASGSDPGVVDAPASKSGVAMEIHGLAVETHLAPNNSVAMETQLAVNDGVVMETHLLPNNGVAMETQLAANGGVAMETHESEVKEKRDGGVGATGGDVVVVVGKGGVSVGDEKKAVAQGNQILDVQALKEFVEDEYSYKYKL